jgi:16S rRNA processing protein RimM
MLIIGRIVGVHGVRGEVKMDIYSDRPEEIPKLRRIYLDGETEPRTINRPRGNERQAIIKITGIDTRDEAETLRGTIVRIRANQLSPRDDGTYYHYQIIGLNAFLEDDSLLGEVTEVLETGEVDVYVIRQADGTEHLLPALSDVVLDINPEAGRMTVRLLDYVDA